MQTATLGEIVRQKDPSLKEAVEQLARGDVLGGVASLDQQGRVHEIVDPQERLNAIAREYSRNPEGTLVISPDNESRRELNSLIHREMQDRGDVSKEEHKLRVLDSRQEMTGADRQWAGQYEAGDVVRYSRGSKTEGIEPGEYARVTGVDAERKPHNDRTRERSTRRPTIRDDSRVYRCTAKPNANSHRATAFSSPRHQENCTLLTVNSARSNKSTLTATLESGWTQAGSPIQHPRTSAP